MKLTLKRRFFASTYTIGSLLIDGGYFCDTLEDANRDVNKNGKFDGKERKVLGETCVPFGAYEVKVTMSPRFKRELPRLYNVPNFEGVLIHRGNSAKDTSGCILVGENKMKGGLVLSSVYEMKLTETIKQAEARGERVTIEII